MVVLTLQPLCCAFPIALQDFGSDQYKTLNAPLNKGCTSKMMLMFG